MAKMMEVMQGMQAEMARQQAEVAEKLARLQAGPRPPVGATSLPRPSGGAPVAESGREMVPRKLGPKVDPPPKFPGREEEWRMFSLKMRAITWTVKWGSGWTM